MVGVSGGGCAHTHARQQDKHHAVPTALSWVSPAASLNLLFEKAFSRCQAIEPVLCAQEAIQASSAIDGDATLEGAAAFLGPRCTAKLDRGASCGLLAFVLSVMQGKDAMRDGTFEKALGTACGAGAAEACALWAYALQTGYGGVPIESIRASALGQHACVRGAALGCFVHGASVWRKAKDEGDAEGLLAAQEAFAEACDQGHGAACQRLATIHMEAGSQDSDRMPLGIAMLEKGCALGVLESCYELGVAHRIGHGAALDPAHALDIFRHACDEGLAAACLQLAEQYHLGEGTERDLERALEYEKRGQRMGDHGGILDVRAP